MCGATTATVTGFSQLTTSTYDLTVSGGDLLNFNGVVGLNLAAGQNIKDLAGNSLDQSSTAGSQQKAWSFATSN